MPKAAEIVLLDAGPLGMISHPRAATENTVAFEWFAGSSRTE